MSDDVDQSDTKAKRPVGRPRKEQPMKMTPVHFYMPSQAALDRLKQAAEAEGLNLSSWARMVLMREANRVLGSD